MKNKKTLSILSGVIMLGGLILEFVGNAIGDKMTEQTIREQVDEAIKARTDGNKKK